MFWLVDPEITEILQFQDPDIVEMNLKYLNSDIVEMFDTTIRHLFTSDKQNNGKQQFVNEYMIDLLTRGSPPSLRKKFQQTYHTKSSMNCWTD